MMKNRKNNKAERREPLHTVAETIVRGRFVIFALFLLAALFCVLSLGRVRINSDLTAFLPRDTETRRGLAVMESEFTTYGTARILIEEVPCQEAERIAAKIAEIGHVADVGFDASEAHYKDGNALLSVTFDEEQTGDGARAAMEEIRETLGALPYSFAVQSEVGYDYQSVLAREMVVVLALSVAVIVAVLLFTSRSYFEVVIFFIVFAFAALLNMGTNFWLGEISAITNSVAVILQLALAIDYAIIFAHRYQDEAERGDDERAALIRALSRSIVEIFSSSLTTVSGLIALTLMRFRLGYDLGIVLSKGILCSMLTVFCLMPGLICLFPRALKKTRHRSFVPNVRGWGRFLSKKVPVFLLLFALILPFSIVFSRRTEYAFANETVTEIIPNAERAEARHFNATFPAGTAIALLVPAGDREKEKTVLSAVAELEYVTDATGLVGIPVGDGKTLTDPFTPREFAALVGVEESKATLLYRSYARQNQAWTAVIFPANYRVPLLDILYYLFNLIDSGTVELTDGQSAQLNAYRNRIDRAVRQLQGENWDRLIVTTSLPTEGDESVALVERIRAAAEREYGEGGVLVVGNITSARDLSDCYRSDSVLISVLTIVFVFVILLFTFRSPLAAAILVFIIQGSVWINFSMPYLTGSHPSFVTNMIVSAIQMGATIDYAIVMMSRYRARRAENPPREAMANALNDAFPTVVTSGTIMAAASLLIAYRVSDVYVGHIGLAVGRGTLISAFLVLTVLPQLLPLTDREIFLTTVRFHRKKAKTPSAPAPDSSLASTEGEDPALPANEETNEMQTAWSQDEGRQIAGTVFPSVLTAGTDSLTPGEARDEMLLDLFGYHDPLSPLAGVEFGFFDGDREELLAAVQKVEPHWAKYYGGREPAYCGFVDGKVVAFCLLSDFGEHEIAGQTVRVGGTGCVGTIPAYRRRGIGLKMVAQGTAILSERGFRYSYIHDTGVPDWYAKLGYRSIYRRSN